MLTREHTNTEFSTKKGDLYEKDYSSTANSSSIGSPTSDDLRVRGRPYAVAHLSSQQKLQALGLETLGGGVSFFVSIAEAFVEAMQSGYSAISTDACSDTRYSGTDYGWLSLACR